MKNFFLYVFLIIFSNNFSYGEEWKIQNKWKISCGLVNKEALVVNGEPKKRTDGPYGPNKPYIKIGMYRIGDKGTTSFAYDNVIIKNKK